MILAKQEEVAAFDAVRTDRKTAMKAQMKASLRSMYDASRAYFERLVAMQVRILPSFPIQAILFITCKVSNNCVMQGIYLISQLGTFTTNSYARSRTHPLTLTLDHSLEPLGVNTL